MRKKVKETVVKEKTLSQFKQNTLREKRMKKNKMKGKINGEKNSRKQNVIQYYKLTQTNTTIKN